MRALLLIVMMTAGCASSRVQLIAPFSPGGRLCLESLPGRAPVDVVDDLRARVEAALAGLGIAVVQEPPCEQRGEISISGGYPWLFGWVAERLSMRVRDHGGRLLLTIEQIAPMGGTYVFYMVDAFTDSIRAAFRGAH